MFKIRPPAECMANWSSFNRFDEPHVLETTCQINFKPSRWDTGLMRFRIRTCLTDTTVSDNYYDLLNPVSINSFNVLKSFQFVSEADLMIRLYIFKQTKHQLSWIAASVSPPAVTACTTEHKRQTLDKATKWFLSQSESTISVQVYCHWVGTTRISFQGFHFIWRLLKNRDDSMLKEILFKTVFSVLLTTDLVGNTLVILIIVKNRSMKTPMNYLLLNLAVADIIVGIFFAPRLLFISLFTHPTGTRGNFLCKMVTGMNVTWVASLASAFTLVSVAVERFYAVVYPMSVRHKVTNRKLKFIVPACWILATLHTIPSFMSSSFDDRIKLCREVYPEYWQYVSYWFFWVLGAGIIPVSVMTVLYTRVIHSLWCKDTNNAPRLAVINARKRITQKSITVSIIYAICIFPTHVLYFVSIFYPKTFSDNDLYFKTTYCLLALNSSVNPFVYTFQCTAFRRNLKKLVSCNNRVCLQVSDRSTSRAIDIPLRNRTGGVAGELDTCMSLEAGVPDDWKAKTLVRQTLYITDRRPSIQKQNTPLERANQN